MGRKKIPSKIHLLRGNPGKRKLNTNEPEPEILVPKMPDFLNAEAQKEWERITPLLAELGLISEIDKAALSAYCQSFSRYCQLERMIDDGAIDLGTLRAARQQAQQMRQFLQEFGMSPSARTKVATIKVPKKAQTEYEQWKNRGPKPDDS